LRRDRKNGVRNAGFHLLSTVNCAAPDENPVRLWRRLADLHMWHVMCRAVALLGIAWTDFLIALPGSDLLLPRYWCFVVAQTGRRQ
jgi:hypothetical protein